MPTWPSTLPCLSLDAAETWQDGTIRTEMSAGPAKSRRRFSAISRYITVTIPLDATQRATLRTFYEGDLAGGSLTFDVADPADGATVQARFSGPPSFGYSGKSGALPRWFMTTLSVEILP